MRFQPAKAAAKSSSGFIRRWKIICCPCRHRKSDEAFLFPALAQRNVSPLSKHFRKIMDRARIEQRVIASEVKSGRNVNALSFHSLRHSFSLILAKRWRGRRNAHGAHRPHYAGNSRKIHTSRMGATARRGRGAAANLNEKEETHCREDSTA